MKNSSVDKAFAYCAAITEAHYENFPVASLFLPAEKRPYIQAIYAFSRIADDFADEFAISREERLLKLDDWESKLRLCYEGEADDPVFIALKETVKKLEIPIEPLLDLLTAFRKDVTTNRYETFDQLLEYCRCSANPVGRLVLMVFNYREESLFTLSDSICTALQLANFWQDLRVDREKDRLYIPLEDCNTHSYDIKRWKEGVADESFRRLMRFEVKRTRELFYGGAELPSLVAKDLQLELKLIWLGGMEILNRIERSGYDLFFTRPTLSAWNKFTVLARGFLINDLRYYRRKKPRKEPWDLT